MKIKEITIRNFGKFHDKKITFAPGLNVVCGGNESGKSTLHTFLVSMLFGMEKARGRGAKRDNYTQYEPWNSASFYCGEMEFEVGGKPFHLERNFYHKEKQSHLINLEDGEQLNEEYGDLQMLLGGLTRELYENTCCISQTGVVPGKELASFIQDNMVNAASSGDGNLQVNQALAQLTRKKNQTAKDLKEERTRREHQLEKLRIEREILEEDIERKRLRSFQEEREKDHQPMASEKSKPRAGTGIRMMLLALACFLVAGTLLVTSLTRVSLSVAIAVDAVICMFAIMAAAILRGKAKKQTDVGGETGNIMEQELREKQTRLFNILEEQTELEDPTPRELELQEYLTAYDLAGKTIHMLTGEIYEDFGDRINSRTSEILSQLTEGRYDRVEISGKMEVSVYSGSRVCRPDQLSTGTLEQIYFALRMSLGELFSREEEMPFLLDETFARYDEKRIRRVLQWLGRQGRQMILFTCQKREMEYLEELGIPYEKIELEGN